MRPPVRVRAALLCVALVALSCTVNQATDVARLPADAVRVGAYAFTESRVLAHLYALVLEERGVETAVVTDVASREVMEPALEQDHVDLVPEYQGTLLTFLRGGPVESRGPRPTHAALSDECQSRGLRALDYAPGENKNEVVVTSETAAENDLETIGDLRPHAPQLVLGGPPECPGRPLCLPGLERTYGLDFESFLPLDVGGPRTIAALEGREVDVGVLFTTNPQIPETGLTILEDNRNLQPSENVVPIVRAEVADEWGPDVTAEIDALSRALTTEELRDLNAAVDEEGLSPRDAAREWLELRGDLR